MITKDNKILLCVGCVQCLERVRCLAMGSNTDYLGETKLKAACSHALGHCWEDRRHPEILPCPRTLQYIAGRYLQRLGIHHLRSAESRRFQLCFGGKSEAHSF